MSHSEKDRAKREQLALELEMLDHVQHENQVGFGCSGVRVFGLRSSGFGVRIMVRAGG